jgi:hypothetical protein
MTRVIGCRVFFDWGLDGSFTDESANLVSVSGDTRFVPPEALVVGSQGIVDKCTIELRNTNGRYSALNASSPIYSLISGGKIYQVPVYVETTVNGSTWTKVFRGVTKIPRETGRTYEGMPTVRFDCRTRDDLLLQERDSTTQANFRTRADTVYTEAKLIKALLEDQGLTEGTDFVVDAGLVPIQWAWLDDESPLEEIWQLAAATGGRFYVDQDGVYRYENMTHWLYSPHTTSQETYDISKFKSLEAWYEDKELYSRVTVEYASRQIDDDTVIWQPDEVVQIPAGGSRTIWATFSYPAYTEPVITWKAATLGGTLVTSGVTITATWYAQRAKLVIANKPVLIVPFQITAQVVSGGPSADAEEESTQAFFTNRGKRSRSLRGNVYVQSRAQAAMLAAFLRVRHEVPRLWFRLSGVLGNGARRPGDRITVSDPSVMSADREAMVLGVRWSYSEQSYLMDLEAMDATDLFPFATTTPAYFKIGTNKLGATDAARGRVFF